MGKKFLIVPVGISHGYSPVFTAEIPILFSRILERFMCIVGFKDLFYCSLFREGLDFLSLFVTVSRAERCFVF